MTDQHVSSHIEDGHNWLGKCTAHVDEQMQQCVVKPMDANERKMWLSPSPRQPNRTSGTRTWKALVLVGTFSLFTSACGAMASEDDSAMSHNFGTMLVTRSAARNSRDTANEVQKLIVADSGLHHVPTGGGF